MLITFAVYTMKFLTGFLLCSFTLVDILKTTAVEKLPSDLEGMEASMQRLLALIDDIYKYVDDVVVTELALLKFCTCFSPV